MRKRTATPKSGQPLRIEPHYRLTEPMENNLEDARALLAMLGDLALLADRRQQVTFSGEQFAGAMRLVLGLLPDSMKMEYVPLMILEG